MSDTAAKLTSLSELLTYEASPVTQRYPILNSFELINNCGQRYLHDAALQFLPTATRGEASVRVSYAELAERVTQTANLLHTVGVRPRDTVSLLLPSLPETHYALWGGQAAGIASPINPLLDATHISEIMNATHAKVLVTQGASADSEVWAKVEQIIANVPCLETLLLIGSTDGADNLPARIKILNFNAAISVQPATALISRRSIGSTDVAAYFHTGGTTGRPKIAQLTHGNIAFASQVYADCTSDKGRYAMLCGLPLFHIFGTVAAGIASLFAGRTLVIMTPQGFRSPNVAPNWWYFVERFQVKGFAVVPAILDTLIRVPVGDSDISNLREITSGASPLNANLRQDFEEKFNVTITNGYGMTESSCLLARPIEKFNTPLNSVGTRLPYMEMRIGRVDEERQITPCNAEEVGDILVKGPHIFSGYLNPTDNVNVWFDDEWFNTGDRGYIDENGFLFLTGRAKDLIIRGGHNIDPALIEEPLNKHPAIAVAAAIGQPDIYASELPIAYVTLKPGCSASVVELLEYCKATISERAAIPKRIVIIDQMPLTTVSKIYKPELRNRATEWVIAQLLSSEAIEASVIAKVDAKRGQIATVNLQNPKLQTPARTLLERLPVHIDLA